MVEIIWREFDTDGNGTLDKQETRQFVNKFMSSQGVDENMDEEQYNEFFNNFDKDGSGCIEKPEIKKLLRQMLGIKKQKSRKKMSKPKTLKLKSK